MTIPTFEEQTEIYERCLKELSENGLVLKDEDDGFVIIVHPTTQREYQIQQLCLWKAGLIPDPPKSV